MFGRVAVIVSLGCASVVGGQPASFASPRAAALTVFLSALDSNTRKLPMDLVAEALFDRSAKTLPTDAGEVSAVASGLRTVRFADVFTCTSVCRPSPGRNAIQVGMPRPISDGVVEVAVMLARGFNTPRASPSTTALYIIRVHGAGQRWTNPELVSTDLGASSGRP